MDLTHQPLALVRGRESRWFASALGLIFFLISFEGKMRGCFDTWFRYLVPLSMELPVHFNRGVNWYPMEVGVFCAVGILGAARLLSLSRAFVERPLAWMGGVFGVALLSTACSAMARYPLQYVQLGAYACAPLFFLLIIRSRQWLSPRQLMRVCSASLICGGVIQATLALIQYVTQEDVGLYRLGESSRSLFPFSCSHAERGHLFRASGTFFHPNCLGAFLMSTLMCTLYGYLRQQANRMLLGAAFLLQLGGLLVSFSRSAFLGMGVTLCCFAVLMIKLKQDASLWRSVLRSMAYICVLIVLGVIVLFPVLKERGGMMGYNAMTLNADRERIDYMKVAVEEIKQHPLLGVGFNNFALYGPALSETLTGRPLHYQVHNIYLLIASEIGLVGFSLFMAFIISILRVGCRFIDTTYALERAVLISLFLGLLVIGMTDFFLWWKASGRLLFFGIAALLYAVSMPSHFKSVKNL